MNPGTTWNLGKHIRDVQGPPGTKDTHQQCSGADWNLGSHIRAVQGSPSTLIRDHLEPTGRFTHQGCSGTAWNQVPHQQCSGTAWNQVPHQQCSGTAWNQVPHQQCSGTAWNLGSQIRVVQGSLAMVQGPLEPRFTLRGAQRPLGS